MKLNTCFLIFILLMGILSTPLYAQENNYSESDAEKHQIGFLLAHTHIKQSKNRISLPSFSLFYNYYFNKKWSLGLHTDFMAEQFIIESNEKKTVERENPIAPAIMLGYKPWKHFSFLLGSGADFDKKETLGLIRLDTEYSTEITNKWEFIASLGYDIRFNAFNSLQIGIGLSKNF